ncbi:hypothetical protein MASR1M12_40970 [Erysipelotrichia bacterium]
MSLENEILDLLLETIVEFDQEVKIEVKKGREAALFGNTGGISSMSLVSLIVEVEQAIEQRFGKSVTLADEKAFSQARSPFRTIGSLADYILKLLAEE